MIVQMKGASINTTAASSSFGDTTALNEAGNYEIGTVCYIIGDSVFLFHNLLNTYNTTSGKVQLVQFAEYYAAEVIDTVKATPWIILQELVEERPFSVTRTSHCKSLFMLIQSDMMEEPSF